MTKTATTTLIILAAGRGTRMPRGGIVPKALMPLSQKAALSWNIDGLANMYDDVVVVASAENASIIQEYCDLVHSRVDINVVIDDNPCGPGGSLHCAMENMRDFNRNVLLTSCDTLWHHYMEACTTMSLDESWMSIAAMPIADDDLARWCRVSVDGEILDKTTDEPTVRTVYTGLGFVLAEDVATFSAAIESQLDFGNMDVQVSAGFANIPMHAEPSTGWGWLDIGDAAAYKQAVLVVDGYDWSKPDEVTYVIKNNVVVKMWRDMALADRRKKAAIARDLTAAVVPDCELSKTGTFLSYPYMQGVSIYEASGDAAVYMHMLAWYDEQLRDSVNITHDVRYEAARDFYFSKTQRRIDMLISGKRVAQQLFDRIVESSGYSLVTKNVEPGAFHGDFAFGNILYTPGDGPYDNFIAIDWREDFAGHINWGDMRYDVAKMLTSSRVHWENARHGDMRPWPFGEQVRNMVKNSQHWSLACEYIGVLSLLNSAPLHISPLDEILVARACEWMEEIES